MSRLLAERLELVGGGGAIRVGGDEQRLAAQLRRRASRASRRRSSCPSPGGRRARRPPGCPTSRNVRSPADSSAVSSSWTIFTTCWPAVRLSRISAPIGALAHARDEVLDDLEVDVGLEQREADLAHRGVDVGLGHAAATGQPGEGLAEAVAEAVEHAETATLGCRSGSGRAATAGRVVRGFWRHRGGRSVRHGLGGDAPGPIVVGGAHRGCRDGRATATVPFAR